MYRALLPAAMLFSAAVSAAGDIPARFSFTPDTVMQGGSVTISGTGFPANVTIVRLVLGGDNAQSTTLGHSGVTNGQFTATVTIPAGTTPGRYGIGVVDPFFNGAINLTGSLAVAPANAPWFQFTPLAVAPGGQVTVSARLISPSSAWAIVGLLDNLNNLRWLGSAVLNNGSFDKTFTVPASLGANRVYTPVVVSAQGQFAANVTGPFSIARNAMTAMIPVGSYPVGIEVNPATNRVYVPNAGANTLSVIDGNTNSALATLPTGELPCAIAANPYTNRIYVANLNSNDVTVIDGATNTIVTTVPVGTLPCAVRILPSLNRVYVGNYFGDTISVIDGGTNQVVETIPLGGSPYGMASNPLNNRVYVATGGGNTLKVINGFSNTIIATVPVGRLPDAVAVNPQNGRIYVANYYSDTLTVLDGTTHAVLATVPVGKQPSGVAVNPVTGRVFIGNYASNTVTVVNGLTNAVADTFAAGITPDGITLNPVTGKVYSADSNSNAVSVFTDAAPIRF
jgi:YVTN family beta-propeller protein